MIGGLAAGLADSKDDCARDLVHHALNVRLQRLGANVGAGGFVAATDIIANATGRDSVAVGDHAADGQCISPMSICHKCSRANAIILRASVQLRNCSVIMGAPYRNTVYNFHISSSMISGFSAIIE